MLAIIPTRDKYFDSYSQELCERSLMYTLRAMEMHIPEVTGVVLVTRHVPEFIKRSEINVYSAVPDNDDSKYRERNIFAKVHGASQQLLKPGDQFVYMHDDHFVTSGFNVHQWWHNKDFGGNDVYQRTIKNTRELYGQQVDNFDLHAPCVMTREGLHSVRAQDWKTYWGFLIKTSYARANKITSKFSTDLKIRFAFDYFGVRGLVKDRTFFSASLKAWEGGLPAVLEELYPKPSRYELEPVRITNLPL